MKLNIFSKDKKPDLPPMMTQQDLEDAHNLLVAIVTGKTPIRFSALKKGEINPLQMVTEVLAYVLQKPHGKQVGEMIAHLKGQLEEGYRKHAEQEAIQKKLQEMHTPIIPANNGGAK